MALTFKRICRGAILETTQPHFEAVIPVDTNEPTEYVSVWDVSRTANDSVRAYLTGTSPNYELHFYGYGATANYALQSSAPYYTAPWASRTSQITRLIFHDGITDIGQFTFSGRKSAGISPGDLQRIRIVMSDTVRVLQRYAIHYAPLLSVELSKGLRRAGNGALYASSDSQSIDFPLSLQVADYTAILGYTGSGATNHSYLKAHTPSGGFFIVGDGVLLWGKPTGTVLTIPEGIKSVCCTAWDNATSFTSLNLPTSTKYIAHDAFYGYSGLRKVKLPQGTERIYSMAFQNLNNLQKIWLPRSVKHITTNMIVTSTGADTDTAYPFTGCDSLTIYCECAQSETPEGWGRYWNYKANGSTVPVVWGISESEFDNM